MKKYIVIFLVHSMLASTYGQSVKELLKQAEANYPLLKAKRYEVQARKDHVSFPPCAPNEFLPCVCVPA